MVCVTGVYLRDVPNTIFVQQYFTSIWVVWPFANLVWVSHWNASRLNITAFFCSARFDETDLRPSNVSWFLREANLLIPDFWQEVDLQSSMALILSLAVLSSKHLVSLWLMSQAEGTKRVHVVLVSFFFFSFFFVQLSSPRPLSTLYTTSTSDRGIEMLK